MTSAKKNERVWPNQVEDWTYWNGSDWLSDPQLTVTGTLISYVSCVFPTESLIILQEHITYHDNNGKSEDHMTRHMFFVLVMLSSFYL